MPDFSPWSPTAPRRPGTRWLLSTPRLTLTAHDGTPLPTTPGPGQFTRLAHTAVRHLARQPEGAIVAGLIPFDEDTPAHLFLARPKRWPRPGSHGMRGRPTPRHGNTPRLGHACLPVAGTGVPEPPPNVYLAHV